MKASQFPDAQKAFILKQGADGVLVAEICRRAGISQATYFNWKKKYEGLTPPEMRRLKLLEEENAQLKKLVADLSLDHRRLSSRSPLRPSMIAVAGRQRNLRGLVRQRRQQPAGRHRTQPLLRDLPRMLPGCQRSRVMAAPQPPAPRNVGSPLSAEISAPVRIINGRVSFMPLNLSRDDIHG
jgi:putative transposase